MPRPKLPKTEPWSIHGGGGVPHWEMLPDWAAECRREEYEERAAIMQFDGGMHVGAAEQMAYAFAFADSPEKISPFVYDEQLETQLMRARIFRGRRELELRLWVQKIRKGKRENEITR